MTLLSNLKKSMDYEVCRNVIPSTCPQLHSGYFVSSPSSVRYNVVKSETPVNSLMFVGSVQKSWYKLFLLIDFGCVWNAWLIQINPPFLYKIFKRRKNESDRKARGIVWKEIKLWMVVFCSHFLYDCVIKLCMWKLS